MTPSVEPLSWGADTDDASLVEPPDLAVPSVPATSSLRAPAAIDCVPAEAVAGLIDRVQDDLARLRRELADTERDAAEVEARLAAEGIDATAAIAIARAVPRLLAELREEAEEHAMAVMFAARVEARAMQRSADPRTAHLEARLVQWRRLVAGARLEPPEPSWRAQRARARDVLVLPAPSPIVPDTSAPAVATDPVPSGMTSSTEPEPEVATVVATDAEHGEGRDFWAGIDASDARRTRRRKVLTRVGALRAAAVACVAAAVVVHFA